ncbi:MAG: Short-chain dehydrogenase [Verrucomicrobiaceae bacterium]|nr:Short-chain dehydrogenase [Verrucomicrobiaceae bacterium]
MSMCLLGKIAVVTGAGRGIGRAIAEQFAAEGAKVVVASRTAETVDEVVSAIRSAGGEAMGVRCDVSVVSDINSAVDCAAKTWGGIDIMVNNAQSFGTREKPLLKTADRGVEEVSEEEWDWIYTTGLKATLRFMQAVFPQMKARGGGSIINFGSARGILSTPMTSPYNAAKEAIRSLSRTAANEWGAHNIRVNVINPVIDTDAYREDISTEAGRKAVEAMIPLRRVGTPLEAARVALFLAGSDSSYITGQSFDVDGGLVSRP